MEKSIKSIWQQGHKGNLTPPKVEQLYSRKSIHVIDKFKRGFRINILAILASGLFILIGSLLTNAAYAGIIMFALMGFIAWSAQKDYRSMQHINKGHSSYAYLMEFKAWLDRLIEKYGLIYRFIYPAIILTFYFGLWFSDIMAPAREHLAGDLYMGIYLPTTIGVVTSAILMGVFSKLIHREDVKLVYGGILKKLEELIQEIEELNAEETEAS